MTGPPRPDLLLTAALTLVPLLALAAYAWRLSVRVGWLEEFDELEMAAREQLGRQLKRVRERLGRDWERADDDDDDDEDL